MGQVGWHVKKIAGLQVVRLAVEGEFTFTGQYLYNRVLRRGVFGQFLAFGKTEEHGARIVGAQQRAADDAVGGKLGFFRQRQNLFPRRINQRLLTHAESFAQAEPAGFDSNQTIRVWNNRSIVLAVAGRHYGKGWGICQKFQRLDAGQIVL